MSTASISALPKPRSFSSSRWISTSSAKAPNCLPTSCPLRRRLERVERGGDAEPQLRVGPPQGLVYFRRRTRAREDESQIPGTSPQRHHTLPFPVPDDPLPHTP